jgi:hypothetical protein
MAAASRRCASLKPASSASFLSALAAATGVGCSTRRALGRALGAAGAAGAAAAPAGARRRGWRVCAVGPGGGWLRLQIAGAGCGSRLVLSLEEGVWWGAAAGGVASHGVGVVGEPMAGRQPAAPAGVWAAARLAAALRAGGTSPAAHCSSCGGRAGQQRSGGHGGRAAAGGAGAGTGPGAGAHQTRVASCRGGRAPRRRALQRRQVQRRRQWPARPPCRGRRIPCWGPPTAPGVGVEGWRGRGGAGGGGASSSSAGRC